MTSLAEALPAEIARVTEIKEMYQSLRGMPGVNVEPAIHFMTKDIEYAITALAEGDVVQMLRCYEVLKDYKE